MYGIRPGGARKHEQHKRRGQELADYCCIRRAGNVHFEHYYEHKVQYNVQHGGEYKEIQRPP